MNGPYPLTNEDIDKRIPVGSIGNYAYGYTNSEGSFVVPYVGRSDSDLNVRAKHGVGQYKQYKYSIALTAKAAFEKECKNYHYFGGPDGKLDNKIHPDAPDGTNYSCSVCPKWTLDI